MSDLEIVIASLAEADDLLSSPASCRDYGFVVSIGDPEDGMPSGYQNVPDKLRLVFYDTVDELGPTLHDVKRLIEFARIIADRPAKVLTHCMAGISRSSAAAYIIHAVTLGEGREEEALRLVLNQRSIASPNRKMVEMADQLLERRGAMIEALRKYRE